MTQTRVAIVGLALRAPGGVDHPEAYWSALASGRVLIGDLPEDRRSAFGAEWDEVVTRAGYLDDVFDFDRRFFGLSPRECRMIDPQHRLLLEVTWEAFEDAGILPASVAPTTSVVVGITGQDYRHWLRAHPNAYVTTGNGHCFAAGRLSYTLGLGGPAMAVDTACSSSLVALDAGCRLLSTRACDAAVVGGVNLLLSPRTTLEVSRTGALSPDGCSRPFDAAANGFVRAEGCGVLVLKRLDDAERDGDRVRAVIEATGLNQDGGTETFTAPNGNAQAELIRTVLAAAEVEPADVGYHEAHGTSTPLGDPVEMASILCALGRQAGDSPLHVGSVKANVGHAEAAAGVLSVVKAVLCLEQRCIPPHPTFECLNPRIDLDGSAVAIPTRLTEWAVDAGQHATVSSYGMSGTNAFAVLSRGPDLPTDHPHDGQPATGLLISAASEASLRVLAGRYREDLSTVPAELYGAYTAVVTHGRTVLPCARWIDAADPETARDVLGAVHRGEPDTRAVVPTGGEVLPPRLPRSMVGSLPTYPWERERYVVAPSGDAS